MKMVHGLQPINTLTGFRRPRALTQFQREVLQYFEENGDGNGCSICGHYYTEDAVRWDPALAEHLYWQLGGSI